MRIAVLSFFIGVLSASFLPTLPDFIRYWWLLPGLALLVFFWRIVWLRSLALLVTGFVWLVIYAQLFGPSEMPHELEGQPFEASGIIVSIPECNAQRCRFDFDISKTHSADISWSGRVRISWYYPKVVLLAGQQWRLRLKLKYPHGFANPGGFDYESWLYQRGISATGYVRKPGQARQLDQIITLNSIRQDMSERLHSMTGESLLTGLIQALATGDRQHIDANQWQVLRRTGTSHLMAISGLHVGLLYGLFFWLGRYLWSLSARLCLVRPAQDLGVVIGLLAAIAYAALAGFAIPTQRALVMLLVVGFTQLTRRITSPIDVLLLALGVVLCIDPLSILSPGFWLSFTAVAVILAVIAYPSVARSDSKSGSDSKWVSWLYRLVVIQLVITLGLFPLLIVFFHQVSLVAPLMNLLAVPWVSFTVVPLTLMGAVFTMFWPAAAEGLLSLAVYSLETLWRLLQAASETSYAIRHVAQPELWVMLLAAVAVAGLFLIRHRWWRLAGLPLLLPLIIMSPRTPESGAFWVDVLDVGQGLSVVVRTSGHSLLFDTGFSAGKEFDVSQRVILPYLWHEGISKLDTVIVSHDDKDHAGGLGGLLSEMPTDQLLLTPGSKYARYHANSSDCQAGRRWQWDGVAFEILHPDHRLWREDNNQSCVLRVSNPAGSILLTSDIEKKVEQDLLRRYGEELASTVLLVPHHGSKTSSTPAFIEAVNPQVVIYPVGYRNRFKLPYPAVVERYDGRQLAQYRTDWDGLVTARFQPADGPVQVTTYRQEHRRFWQHTPQRSAAK